MTRSGTPTGSTGTTTMPLRFAGDDVDAETASPIRVRITTRGRDSSISRDPLVVITGSAYGYLRETC